MRNMAERDVQLHDLEGQKGIALLCCLFLFVLLLFQVAGGNYGKEALFLQVLQASIQDQSGNLGKSCCILEAQMFRSFYPTAEKSQLQKYFDLWHVQIFGSPANHLAKGSLAT